MPQSLDDTSSVRVLESVRAELLAHARREAPNECCGLLVGTGSVIDESVCARNLDASPTRYLLDPAEHIATNRRLRGTGRHVVGVYHSHPAGPAVPSASDVAEALYPEFVWIIVSLLEPGGQIAAYRLTGGGMAPLAIYGE